MKERSLLHRLFTILGLLVLLLVVGVPTRGASANATCRASQCNWMDPYGTTCWNDAINAVVRFGPNGSYFYNVNKYSPGCVANWSYTRSTNGKAWLAAQTAGVYTYHGDRLYNYVWNNMWDGSNTVCTRGYKGFHYKQYNWVTPYGCG